MLDTRRIRVLVAKPGLDGHDRGAKDVIGLSILSGAHRVLVPRVLKLLQARGADDVMVLVGGIIPREDAAVLRDAGVAEVFGPGTSTQDVVDFIQRRVGAARC